MTRGNLSLLMGFPCGNLARRATWLAAQIHGIRNQTILYCRSRLPYLSSQSLTPFRKMAPHLITGSLLRTMCPSCHLQERSKGISRSV
jgi:hypothetical protein